MKVLSKATVYGIRALVYIAVAKNGHGYVNIGDLSRELDISFHFLTKILQTLNKHGILESYRGPNGGVVFLRPPEEIYVIDLVNILEGEDFFNTCLLGLPGCGHFAPCPVHDFWKVMKDELREEFETTSIAELGTSVSQKRLRLSP